MIVSSDHFEDVDGFMHVFKALRVEVAHINIWADEKYNSTISLYALVDLARMIIQTQIRVTVCNNWWIISQKFLLNDDTLCSKFYGLKEVTKLKGVS